MSNPLTKLAWQTIKARPPYPAPPKGLVDAPLGLTGRPKDFREIGIALNGGIDFETAWGDFLHGFYLHKAASQLAYRPPKNIRIEWQALMAGAAEWLAAEFNLPKPQWVDDPVYSLKTTFDPIAEMVDTPDLSRWLETPPAFRSRNIIFDPRKNLVAL